MEQTFAFVIEQILLSSTLDQDSPSLVSRPTWD